MKRHPSFIPLLAALVVAACSREPRAVSAEGTYTDTTTYTDASQPIHAAAGTEFQITIQSNQSTGYQWVLVDSGGLGPVKSAGTRYVVPRELRDRDGAGGAEWWTFQALRPGQGTISLIHVRPWENTAPKDTTRFRVVVR
ncbi:MAG TPA: protease inhibitor I42 family protein [Longimicrobium sp.]|nr:protease inhibitor I42 family protein [Longimicrobium sp.]